MSFLRKLFRHEEDPLLERARSLVPAARANAGGMLRPLSDQFSSLLGANDQQWDFVVTVAGVFMAATRLNDLHLEDRREESLMGMVAERLDEWDPDGARGFEDCKAFFETTYNKLTSAGHDPRFIASDALGNWIVWNILGRAPRTDDELMFARTTGAMVIHHVHDWWKL